MKKLAKLTALTALLFVYCTIFFTPPALAYIDPSTTTYVIQAVAGIVVAVGSVAVIYWRKAKKRLNEKLGVDLDKNKEVEDDVIVKED